MLEWANHNRRAECKAYLKIPHLKRYDKHTSLNFNALS
jgi:hypothetical protein